MNPKVAKPHATVAENVQIEEDSGLRVRDHQHARSVEAARALLDGPDDAVAEASAWERLCAKLRSEGIDPEV
jgi:hypothetical protein